MIIQRLKTRLCEWKLQWWTWCWLLVYECNEWPSPPPWYIRLSAWKYNLPTWCLSHTHCLLSHILTHTHIVSCLTSWLTHTLSLVLHPDSHTHCLLSYILTHTHIVSCITSWKIASVRSLLLDCFHETKNILETVSESGTEIYKCFFFWMLLGSELPLRLKGFSH